MDVPSLNILGAQPGGGGGCSPVALTSKKFKEKNRFL